MLNAVFGEVKFDTGWKTKHKITIFDTEREILIVARAYFEKDGITLSQEQAFSEFKLHMNELLKAAEKELEKYSGNEAATRFAPQMVLFERDGSYALLLEDKTDLDDGIAVTFKPELRIVSQDEYL